MIFTATTRGNKAFFGDRGNLCLFDERTSECLVWQYNCYVTWGRQYSLALAHPVSLSVTIPALFAPLSRIYYRKDEIIQEQNTFFQNFKNRNKPLFLRLLWQWHNFFHVPSGDSGRNGYCCRNNTRITILKFLSSVNIRSMRSVCSV